MKRAQEILACGILLVILTGCVSDGVVPRVGTGSGPPAGWSPADPGTSRHSRWIDFDADVLPILENRCRPCHFPGGEVFEAMPFDYPPTIRRLGTDLFTRLKDEEDRTVVRLFLAQPEYETSYPAGQD